MPRKYLKKATLTSKSDASDVHDLVQEMLTKIEAGGDDTALEYAAKLDKYDGPILLSKDEIAAASAKVPQRLKDDIAFAHDNVRRFAEVQKSTMQDVELEIVPGLIAGQKAIPCQSAGCYVPGGRYSHIASAIMTVTTAKVAGCGTSQRARRRARTKALHLPLSIRLIFVAQTKSSQWGVSKVLPR